MVKNQFTLNGPVWKRPGLAESHLAKRIKRKHVPPDWTMQEYDGKIRQLITDPSSQVYRYRQEGFEQDYYVFGDGDKWIAILGQDGIMETAFPLDKPSDYRNYLTIDKGNTYMGTVKEVEEGAD